MTQVVMPLSKALHILADIHTREDRQTGFVVLAGAGPYHPTSRWGVDDYIRAWASVRAHLHMPIEPEKQR